MYTKCCRCGYPKTYVDKATVTMHVNAFGKKPSVLCRSCYEMDCLYCSQEMTLSNGLYFCPDCGYDLPQDVVKD